MVQTSLSRWRLRRQAEAAGAASAGELVIIASTLMACLAVALRGWALSAGWFASDDYALLAQAHDSGLGLDQLLRPYAGQLMPGGRLAAWVVERSGTLNWQLAAAITVTFEALAAAAAVWMLLTVFGPRWRVLGPLALYLTSPFTVPAMMSWTTALQLVPAQGAVLLAVTVWLRHLRRPSHVWATAMLGCLCLGLFFSAQALLIEPLLVFLTLAYFTSGDRRLFRDADVRTWTALAGGLVLSSLYGLAYLRMVPGTFVMPAPSVVADTAGNFVGTAFATGALGGPWRWLPLPSAPPIADPPQWTVHASWAVLALVIFWLSAARTRAVKAWVIVVGYLLVALAFLVTGPAAAFGPLVGLEFRYLTLAACLSLVALSLAQMAPRGSTRASAARQRRLVEWLPPPYVASCLFAAVSLSGVVSSTLYVREWKASNTSAPFMKTLAADLKVYAPADFVDAALPPGVVSPLTAPYNELSRLAPLFSSHLFFPRTSDNLALVDPEGHIRRAVVFPTVVSKQGAPGGCAWRVGKGGTTIPLMSRLPASTWWARIGYISSRDTEATVTAGGDRVPARIEAGTNNLFVQLHGEFSRVRIVPVEGRTRLCVETVYVGTPVPEGETP